MKRILTLKRFEEILAAYGADCGRWPDAERDSALALLARSPELQRRVGDALALDSILDRSLSGVTTASIANVTTRLSRSVAALKAKQSASLATRSGFGAFLWQTTAATWPRAAALAGVVLLGIAIGLVSDPVYSNASNTEGLLDVSTGTSEIALLDGLDQ